MIDMTDGVVDTVEIDHVVVVGCIVDCWEPNLVLLSVVN